MAGKNANSSGRIIDFYQMFSLDQNASAKEIKKSLRAIQSDIRTAMSDGSLNGEEILSKLQDQEDKVVLAMKCFKNDEAKEKYDKELADAYKRNKVDVEAQKLSQELFEEIATYFAKQQYRLVIGKCLEAIKNNVRDVRLYEYLAKSYRLMNDTQHALEAVNDGLKIDSSNLTLLKVGSRIFTVNYKNYDEAQKYVNQITEIDRSSGTAEQVNLYMNFGKTHVAYQTIDEYVTANPGDISFKQQCAYDIVGVSYGCYEACKAEDGEEVSLILSEDAYKECLEYCQKAVSLYKDENTQNALEYAQHFGETEFNEDNRSDIRWCLASTALMLIILFFGRGEGSVGMGAVLPYVLMFAAMAVITGGLIKESRRPYWQIYKYIFTGEREPRERVFLVLGKILSWYMRISWWLAKAMWRLIFILWRIVMA